MSSLYNTQVCVLPNRQRLERSISMVLSLRHYQTQAATAFTETSTGVIHMASGLGKTVIAADIIYSTLIIQPGARVLFLCHNRDVITQAHSACKEYINDQNISMSVFSSKDYLTHHAEVVFATFSGIRRYLYLYDHTDFDLVVVDEAHRACAPTYKKTITYFSPKQLLGLTATPSRMDRQDIRDIFGEIVYTYTLAKALAEKRWLAELRYVLLTDNFSEANLHQLKEKVRNGERVTQVMIDECFAQERLDDVATKLVDEYAEKKTIIFAKNIDHATVVANTIPDSVVYHSDLPEKEQQAVLLQFRNNIISRIVVVDKFNEGVDIPDANLLVFLRSTSSETVWLQQLGRGLRRTKDHTHVTVLDYVASYKRLKRVDALHKKVRAAQEDRKHTASTFELLGFNLSFTKELQDIIQILDSINRNLYPTIEEAMVAVQALDPVPKTQRNYSQTYTQNSRLPYGPDKYYRKEAWERIGKWRGFLGQDIPEENYPTIEEVMVAVQTLDPVPKTEQEYSQTYKQNPRLPSSPYTCYGKEAWERIGKWRGFLGKK